MGTKKSQSDSQSLQEHLVTRLTITKAGIEKLKKNKLSGVFATGIECSREVKELLKENGISEDRILGSM